VRRGGYWAELGIDPTDDARAIKRAYASRLKQIDMDADPDGYIALRDARDAALAAAEAGLIDARGEATGTDAAMDALPRFDPALLAALPPIAVVSGFGAPVRLPCAEAPPDGRIIASASAPPPDEYPWGGEPAMPSLEGEATPTPDAHRLGLIAPAIDPAGLAPGDILIARRAPDVDYQAHYDALIAILRPGDENQPPADFAEQTAMQHHFDVLLGDPRMQEIGFFAEAERWFAAMIARTAPRSDALLERAADHFGWSEDADTVDQSPEIAWNIARRRTLRFRSEISQLSHPHHRIWRELRTPANEKSKRGDGLSRSQVRSFLATIRRDHPSLEGEFDWYRVALWEKEMPRAFQFGGAGIAIYITLMLFRVVACSTSPTPSPDAPPYPSLADSSAYLTAQEEEERRRIARDAADPVSHPDVSKPSAQTSDGSSSDGFLLPLPADRPARVPTRRVQAEWKPPVCPPIEENPKPSTPAKECGSGNWFVDGDYPESAVRRGKQGVVRIKATVRTDGTLSDCKVVESSGDEALDSTTCDLAVRRARFTPARDAESNPIEASYSLKMTWTLTH